MTDTLMQHGRHGAEVLAQVMCASFTPLIQSVCEYGGLIATQAGDAFTALFPLEADPEQGIFRALAAAWHIQQHTNLHSRHQTTYGEFTVSAKVGLAVGDTSWGIINSEDGQKAAYYFRGSAVEESALAEHQAAAGEILLSEAYFSLLTTAIEATPVNGFYRLDRLLTDLPEVGTQQLEAPDLDASSRFFPRTLLQQSHSGEFRPVVSLFISLPTVRTETQLDIFMHSLFELQKSYGSLLNRLDFSDKGSHLLLFWGAPVAFENDVERALHFILELQTRTAIPINGGMTYREAFAGFIGSEIREEYTAFGRGVNLAARFMSTAPRGEIWVDEHVYRRARGSFELEFIDSMSFKGFSQPQKVYALYELKERSGPAYDGKLVGRDAELEALHKFIQPLFEGRYPGMLVVRGEPGIGKSRLVHEFLQAQPGKPDFQMQVFRAQCDEILRLSLNPFRYWLKEYFEVSDLQVEPRNKRSFNRKLDDLIAATDDQRLAQELDRTRSFLGALVGLHWSDSLYEQLDAEARFENTMVALGTLLQAESLQNPAILLLEDAHLLDDDAKIFLPRLMRMLTADEQRQYRIALLATARLEGAGLPLDGFEFQQIDLGRLSQVELGKLTADQLGGPAADSLLELLYQRAEGNPFFFEQVLNYLREENLLVRSDQGWEVPPNTAAVLPVDVNALLVARLDRLPGDIRDIVQTAAALGREFEAPLLKKILQADDGLESKLALVELQAIWQQASESRYIFKHALLREAAYRIQARSQRRSLHVRAVEALESLYAGHLQAHYGELAHHAEQADLVEKARQYLHLAGSTAAAGYQNSLAVEYLTRALALTPMDDLEERFELLLEREAIFSTLGKTDEWQQDLAALDTAAEALGLPVGKARVLLRYAEFEAGTGEFPRARERVEQALSILRGEDEPALVMQAQATLAIAQMRLGRLEAAIEAVERGLAVAREQNDLLNQSRLSNNLGMIYLEQRQLTHARQQFEASLGFAQEKGDLRAQALPINNLGIITGFQGDFAASENYYQQALTLAMQTGIRYGEGIVWGNLGWIAGVRGEYHRARLHTEQCLRIAREVGDLYSAAYAQINLSSYAIARNEPETAASHAQQALALARQIGERSAEAWSLTYLGHSLLDVKDYEGASAAYNEAQTIRMELNQPVLAAEPAAGRAMADLERGNLTGAQSHLQPVMQHLDDGGNLDGCDDPVRVYWACYRVLQASADSRAHKMLATAYELLHTRTASIKESQQQAFLQEIEHNRQIIAAWEKEHPADR